MTIYKEYFSVADDITGYRITRFLSIEEIEGEIKNEVYREKVEAVRNAVDEAEKKDSKLKLPAFYPSIYLPKAIALDSNENVAATGLIQFDIDKIYNLDEIRQRIINIPEVIYCFVSPSGDGLKFGVLTDFTSDDKNDIRKKYGYAYDITSEYLKPLISVKLDDAVKNVNQACYFSADTEIHFNKDATHLKVSREVSIRYQAYIQEKANRISSSPTFHPDDKEIGKALSCIPEGLDYDERLPINFALIDYYGEMAIPKLVSHWDKFGDDAETLRKQLEDMVKSHAKKFSGIKIATLFHHAKKHGYQSKTDGINVKPLEVDATEKQKLYTPEYAEKKLTKTIDGFFTNKKSQCILVEAGMGKTKIMTEGVIKKLQENPFLKIAIYIPSHELAEEITDRINQQLPVIDSFEKLKKYPSPYLVTANHIYGKERLCIHPSKEKLSGLKEFDSRFCFGCSERKGCKYLSQFMNLSNVRVYTSDYLFQKPPLFENGVYQNKDGGMEAWKDDWKSDYIIIDEDIIKKALEKESVSSVSYSENTPNVINEIIHGMNHGDSLHDMVKKYGVDIEEAYFQQKYDWQVFGKIKAKIMPLDMDADEIIKASQSNKKNQPPYYPVLEVLLEMRNLIDGDIKEEEMVVDDRVWVSSNQHQTPQLNFARVTKINARFEGKPILYMDASSNEEVIKNYLDIDVLKIPVEYQESINIRQLYNFSGSKNQVVTGNDAEKNSIKIRRFIYGFNPETTGVISYKDFVETDLEEWNGVKMHFGNLRGIDSASDLENLIVVGRYKLPSTVIEKHARGFFGGLKVVKRDDYQEWDDLEIPVNKRYKFSDGKEVEIQQLDFADRRLQLISNQIDESETYQAIHRLRLIHGIQKKNVWILSNKVIADLRIDKLVDARELLKKEISKKNQRIWKQIQDGFRQAKVVVWKKSDICKAAGISGSEYAAFNKNYFDLFENIENWMNGEIKISEFSYRYESGNPNTGKCFQLADMDNKEVVEAIKQNTAFLSVEIMGES